MQDQNQDVEATGCPNIAVALENDDLIGRRRKALQGGWKRVLAAIASPECRPRWRH